MSEDQRLRDFGFEIAARPKKGPARWRLAKREYTEEQALKVIEGRTAEILDAATKGTKSPRRV